MQSWYIYIYMCVASQCISSHCVVFFCVTAGDVCLRKSWKVEDHLGIDGQHGRSPTSTRWGHLRHLDGLRRAWPTTSVLIDFMILFGACSCSRFLSFMSGKDWMQMLEDANNDRGNAVQSHDYIVVTASSQKIGKILAKRIRRCKKALFPATFDHPHITARCFWRYCARVAGKSSPLGRRPCILARPPAATGLEAATEGQPTRNLVGYSWLMIHQQSEYIHTSIYIYTL